HGNLAGPTGRRGHETKSRSVKAAESGEPTVDAPQADRLDLVRRVVAAIQKGAQDGTAVSAAAQVAPRYARYSIQAARQLGLLADTKDRLEVTERGERLLATRSGSDEERQEYRLALSESPILSPLAALVLGENRPTVEAIAEILLAGQMSLVTALRRARTL